MRSGLLYIVEGAKPKRDTMGIWRDAKLIDKVMVRFGTDEGQGARLAVRPSFSALICKLTLPRRIVHAYWKTSRMDAIKHVSPHLRLKSLVRQMHLDSKDT